MLVFGTWLMFLFSHITWCRSREFENCCVDDGGFWCSAGRVCVCLRVTVIMFQAVAGFINAVLQVDLVAVYVCACA